MTKPNTKSTSKSKKPAPPLKSTGYWLMKSEPEAYTIDDFKRDGKTLWTGIRNYLARNYMMTSMRPGDRFLFYHSNCEVTGVAGIGEIVKIKQPDPSATDRTSDYFDPKASADHPIWFCAEVQYRMHLPRVVTLKELRDQPELAQMALLQKGQRLSIQSVSKAHYERVLKLAAIKPAKISGQK